MDWIYIAILYQVLTEFTLKALFIHTGGVNLCRNTDFLHIHISTDPLAVGLEPLCILSLDDSDWFEDMTHFTATLHDSNRTEL